MCYSTFTYHVKMFAEEVRAQGEILHNKMIMKRSVIAVALTLATANVAVAQETTSAQVVTKVTITGSNIARAAKEGTSPIQTITAADIKASGATTVADLMKKVPAMGSDINTDYTSGSGFAKGAATASLRGLGSTSTLILLNGRRMTPSAYADPNNGNSTIYDLNSIPLSALERVEIFKDGASAVYGSDAIGGVINFITKSDYQGAQVSASESMNDDSRFKRKRVNATGGLGNFSTDGYNVMVSAEISKRDRVARRDATDIQYEDYQYLNGRFKSDYTTNENITKYPIILRETAPNSNSFGITRANAATRRVINLGCPASEQSTLGDKDGILPTSTLYGYTFCTTDVDKFSESTGDAKDSSILSRGSLKINDKITAFAEASFTRSERTYTGAPITLGSGRVTSYSAAGVPSFYQAILPIGHPDNPFPANRASVNYRFENLRGGSTTTNDNMRALAGLTGSFGSFDWESGLLWNRSKRDELQYGRLYLPTLNKLNTGTSLAALAADPTIGKDVNNKGKADILQWDAKVSTELGKLAGGAIGFAAGVEVREERINITPDADNAAGRIYGLANTQIDGKRRVNSAFAEVRTPFTKSFEMDFAGRVDKYPGIATSFVPKVGAKWDVTDRFSLRSTFAKGFRAPALSQTLPGGAQYFDSAWDPKRCELDQETPKPNAVAADCLKSFSGVGGANPGLKPEKAKSYSLGMIWSPTKSLDILVDWYKIRKEGEVALPSSDVSLANEDRAPQYVVRDQNPVNFVTLNGVPVPGTGPIISVSAPWQNQGATEVRGIDFEVKARNNLGAWGKLTTSMDASYLLSYKLAESDGAPEYNLAGARANRLDKGIGSTIDNPRLKGSLSTTWTYGDHATTGSMSYVDSVSLIRRRNGDREYAAPFCHFGANQTGADPTDGRDTSIAKYGERYDGCKVNSWMTFNFGYSYTGFKNLSLSMNIQNIFDKAAPYDPEFQTAGYNTGLHNQLGRYFTVSASYVFK
jgi:iron complex outermembrane receptor protein